MIIPQSSSSNNPGRCKIEEFVDEIASSPDRDNFMKFFGSSFPKPQQTTDWDDHLLHTQHSPTTSNPQQDFHEKPQNTREKQDLLLLFLLTKVVNSHHLPTVCTHLTKLGFLSPEHASDIHRVKSALKNFIEEANQSQDQLFKNTLLKAGQTTPTASDFFKSNLFNFNRYNPSRFNLDFETLDVLGKGAFGRVYKCVHRLDGAQYAVKRVKFAFRSINDLHHAFERVTREVRTLAQIQHKHVVRYMSSWFESDRPSNRVQKKKKVEQTNDSFLSSSSEDETITGSETLTNNQDDELQFDFDESSKGNVVSTLRNYNQSTNPFTNPVFDDNFLAPTSQPEHHDIQFEFDEDKISSSPSSQNRVVVGVPGSPMTHSVDDIQFWKNSPGGMGSFGQHMGSLGSRNQMGSPGGSFNQMGSLNRINNGNQHKNSPGGMGSFGQHMGSFGTRNQMGRNQMGSPGSFRKENVNQIGGKKDQLGGLAQSPHNVVSLLHQEPMIEKETRHRNNRLSVEITHPNTQLDDDFDRDHMIGILKEAFDEQKGKFNMVLFITMQLCSPYTLENYLFSEERMKKTSLTEEDMDLVARYMNQILDALSHIHSKSIIHRDLKPANIFLDHNLNCVLGDFGLTKSADLQDNVVAPTPPTPFTGLEPFSKKDLNNHRRQKAKLQKKDSTSSILKSETQHTKGVGTSTYASPEQLEERNYDLSSDIFSVGIIFFELLHPFATKTERAYIIRDLRKGHLPPEFKKKYPAESRMILNCLNPNPTLRPTSRAFYHFIRTHYAKRLEQEIVSPEAMQNLTSILKTTEEKLEVAERKNQVLQDEIRRLKSLLKAKS